MPSETGIWTQDEADRGHVFSYRLAKWIGDRLPKHEPIIDFGCGKGTYLAYLKDRRFEKLLGIEGELLQDFEFTPIALFDLAEPGFEATEKGNALFLEVGEHIPGEFEQIVLDNVCRHVAPGCLLIMSWAVPGQDGYGHINCHDNLWVKNEIEARGFEFCEGESIKVRMEIEDYCSWFRQTLLIFKNTKTE